MTPDSQSTIDNSSARSLTVAALFITVAVLIRTARFALAARMVGSLALLALNDPSRRHKPAARLGGTVSRSKAVDGTRRITNHDG